MKQYDKWAVKRYRQVWLWLVLWVVFLPATQAATNCNAITEIPVSECQSLMELYNSTNGAYWRNNTGWNQTNTPCSWFGVTCSVGHVTKIDLSDDGNTSDSVEGNGLTGQIPDLHLPELEWLYLSSNQLNGSIPDFSNLPNLKSLVLSSNQLSGNIPDFSNLPNLKYLNLSLINQYPSNQLSGNIPNFSKLPNLELLYLSGNQLSGNIPNFSNLPNLTYLDLDRNQLSAGIPNFSNLPSLTNLVLSGNQLSGSIPNFSNLPKLRTLWLSDNQLSGSIPNFSNLPNLENIELLFNQLNGNIPNFSNLPKLTQLTLTGNQLTGSIPDFSNLPNLTNLGLNGNQLSGSIPNFSNLPKLQFLYLYTNQLSGSIPNFTAFNLASLQDVQFSGNCGLTAYDAAQESVLNSKNPGWQTRNWNCPVSPNQPPIASFTATPNSGTAPLTVTLDASTSTDSDGAVVEYVWTINGQAISLSTDTTNFEVTAGGVDNIQVGGNTVTVTRRTFTVVFNTNGNYTVGLTVKDNSDAVSTEATNTVTVGVVKQPPIASFTATPINGPAPLTVTLDYSASRDPDGSIVKYDWNVNGQPISVAAQQKSMSFNTPGTYTISLRVTDNDGLTGETSQMVTVTGSTLSRTLILTNSQKLATLYGPDQANQVMNKLHELANHPDVQGLVIQVENDLTVATAYASRTNDDDKNQANAVAEAIKQVILNQWNEKLENIVIVGDDRVIPFYRIKDGTSTPDPMTLTDDFYSDHPPINNCSGCANPQLYIPDVPSGRLIENPSQIIGVIDTFLANSTLNIGTAVVTGYDFIQDGAQEHCNTLQAIGIATNCMLIGEVWTSNDFLNQVLNTYHDVTSINGHADYSIFGTPNGFVSASDFANATIDFSRTIFYSVGCHAGQNVANDLDLPESLAIRRANYVANTGFGWGGDSSVTLSEELMWNLTKYLIKPQTTLGKAFARAKQQYYADNPNFESYGEKITAESTLYGLPMYQLTSQATAPISTGISATKTQTTQENGLQKDGYAYTWAMATPIATTSGSSFYSIRGATISKDNEPILPKLTNEVTDPDKALHGIIFRGGNYKTVNATPPMQRFSTTTGHLTPEKKFVAPNWYPSVFFTPNALNLTTGKKEMLVATAGQYNPNLTTGQQRIFNNMDFDVYHHANTNDWTPPTTYLTNHNLQANTATVTVTTSDASGVKEVVVAYTDGKGTWNSANLTENGGTWTGNFAATAETEFFVQAVDKTGNVAVNDNGGEYFSFKAMSSLPALGNGFAGGIAVNSGAYQQRVIQNLADTVEVTGEITVAPTDIGKVADIFIYAAAHFPWDANNTYYYTVGEGYSVSPWDQDPYKLVPFIPNVTLGVSHHVSMWKGTFPVTGTLDIFFGYRLPNGILVSNKQPIEATIQ